MILPPALNNALVGQVNNYFEPVDSVEFNSTTEEIVVNESIIDTEITSEATIIITVVLEDDLTTEGITHNVTTDCSC
jgi:hypothetical protein